MFSPLRLALAAVTVSTTLALTIPSQADLVVRAGDPGQDSRSCLSLKDVCDTTTIADPTNALSHPACIALVVCEGPTSFLQTFPPNQPRLSLTAFNVVSNGSPVITQQQFIDFYYGTISSINATAPANGTLIATPEYPSSVDAVIGWWQTAVAWTGFCSTSSIPYSNLADWIQYVSAPGVCGAVQSCNATTNAALPACVPQPITDNGSCAEMVTQCFATGAAPPTKIFANNYCVLAALCYSESTVDVLIKDLTKRDYLYVGAPVLSVNQPRLSQTVFNTLSKGNTFVSQQNMIDAYYGALTNTVQICPGPPGSSTTPCPSGKSGPYPTDASYIINFWSHVSAWTGFCNTRNIPYQNFADYLQYSSTVKGPTAVC